jgi:hypothetical protein
LGFSDGEFLWCALLFAVLKDTIRYAGDLSTRRWATDTLMQMQDFLVERDRVDAENQKQREAYGKKRAEYDKKYGKKK